MSESIPQLYDKVIPPKLTLSQAPPFGSSGLSYDYSYSHLPHLTFRLRWVTVDEVSQYVVDYNLQKGTLSEHDLYSAWITHLKEAQSLSNPLDKMKLRGSVTKLSLKTTARD